MSFLELNIEWFNVFKLETCESKLALVQDIEQAAIHGVSAYNEQLKFDNINTQLCIASGVEKGLRDLELFLENISKEVLSK